ncbi:hypothetical protein COI_0212 [Mannheimia haemolytica serotype A2 str. OVINE]|nr:hypothetical protein COI_0212 [Mannheimia haemolytica serotype A2 str. OVINE]
MMSAPAEVMLPACTCSSPFSSLTCSRALRSRLVSARLKPSRSICVVRVVEVWLKLPAISSKIALSASILPPIFSRSPLTLAASTPPLSVPLFSNRSALNCAKRRPAIVPWFTISLLLMVSASAEIRLPLPSISPLRARAYTFGTNTDTVSPLGKRTVWVSNQTISLVKLATCSGDKVMPNRRLNFCAKVMPASIRALYWLSKSV